MVNQIAFAPFNALIVANNAVEAADLAEFLELNQFGPVAKAMAADEAVSMVQNAVQLPSIVVFALSLERLGDSGFLDMISAMRAPLIWIDMDPTETKRGGVVAVRRPYSEMDLRRAITKLSL